MVTYNQKEKETKPNDMHIENIFVAREIEKTRRGKGKANKQQRPGQTGRGPGESRRKALEPGQLEMQSARENRLEAPRK